MSVKEYPQNARRTEHFTHLPLKIGCIVILFYYLSETLNRIIFFSPNLELPIIEEIISDNWRIGSSAIYAVALLILAIQTIIWRDQFISIEAKRMGRNAFIALFFGGVFTALYDILSVKISTLQYSRQSDLTVLFLFMIFLHFMGLNYLKQMIERMGRHKKTETGRSIFYLLFALNPVIRFLLPFLLLVFATIGGNVYFLYVYYVELVMTYISAVIAIGFTFFSFRDARRIKLAQRMQYLQLEIQEAEKEEAVV